MGCSYHTGLADRVGEQNQEHTQHRSDLDGEAARLALEPEERRWLVSRRSRSEDEAPVHLLPHSGEDTPLITERWNKRSLIRGDADSSVLCDIYIEFRCDEISHLLTVGGAVYTFNPDFEKAKFNVESISAALPLIVYWIYLSNKN